MNELLNLQFNSFTKSFTMCVKITSILWGTRYEYSCSDINLLFTNRNSQNLSRKLFFRNDLNLLKSQISPGESRRMGSLNNVFVHDRLKLHGELFPLLMLRESFIHRLSVVRRRQNKHVRQWYFQHVWLTTMHSLTGNPFLFLDVTYK